MLALAGFTFVHKWSDSGATHLISLAAPSAASQSPHQADHDNYFAVRVNSPTPTFPNSGALRAVRMGATPASAARSAAVVARSHPLPTQTPTTEAAELETFTRRVVNGQPGSLCGLYAAGILALRVVQQPIGDPSYISQEDGTATQFETANPFGAVGLLAHNTLAGRDFFKLSLGQELILIYGDGRAEHFHISEIADYQRLTLADLRSDFLSLDNNQKQTADQVFAKFYQKAHRLTLQTCLRQGDIADWGVHFIVADPN
jgi:hypothetical protein